MNRTSVADWQQLSAMYGLADALDPDSLDDWLQRLEAHAHPLLPQLQQMLDDRSSARCSELFRSVPPAPPVLSGELRETTRREGGRFGRYRLQRRLPDADGAEVWLGQRDDVIARRPDVITLLPRPTGRLARHAFLDRFDRERDQLAALVHPNIVTLHDAGVTADGQAWVAREFVIGEPLTVWCDVRRLDVRARIGLFRQAVLAVRHAHAHLVLHRDLKPDHILVTPRGDVRVLEFGMVQLMEPDGVASVETEIARLSGTPMLPRYAAPEQLLGQPLTTACDVYALGVVLYELLCGERPDEPIFESAALLEQAILDVVPRPASDRHLGHAVALQRDTTPAALRRTIAGDLDAIVSQTLAKQPSQRCVSAEALRAELDRWLAGAPIESRPVGPWGRAGRFLKRQVERIGPF